MATSGRPIQCRTDINPANADLPAQAVIDAIQLGASAWSIQSNADFNFYYMGKTTGTSFSANLKNEVFFRNAQNGSLVAETYRWYNGAGEIIDSDIVFYDGGWLFTTTTQGSCARAMVLENFATHEFGHMLGLSHSASNTATMYPSGKTCSTDWMSLDPDDLAGVEALYPPSSVDKAPVVSITSPTSGASATADSAVTFTGSATDVEDGNLSGGIVWTSSVDGALGTGASLTKSLSVGKHIITAKAKDSAGIVSSTDIAVTVLSSSTVTTGVTLSAEGFYKYGVQRVRLGWTGASGNKVDVYRNGKVVLTVPNDGAQVDQVDTTGALTYTYKVCERASTTKCSPSQSVTF